MAARMSIWSPAPRTFRTLPSLRHTPSPTRITPTRSSSPTTIPEPPPPTTPARRTPATAAPPSPASTQALSQAGHGTNFGDPVTLYNKPTSTFFAIFLATGCGGQGIGAWKSTDGGVTWATGACIHNGGSDDRESGWSDNNPSSPFFGRMYVSWNNFAVGAAPSKSPSPLTTVTLGPCEQ